MGTLSLPNRASRDLVRLATTDGADSGFGSGSTHVQALLEHLAVIESTGSASLRAMLDLVQRDGQGALIVIVGRTAGDELAATARLRQRFGLITVVRVDPATAARTPQQEPPGSMASVIRVTADAPFPSVWNRAMAASPTTATVTGSMR